MGLEDIERRLKILEDIEAIKKLKARYCASCDDHFNPDAIAALFTEDAVWDGGIMGRAEGREKIRRFFTRTPEVMPFAVHMVLNPLIEVEGDAAKGTWYLLQACTHAPENRAVWGSARYDETYVRVGSEWKFKTLKLTSFFWTPFEEGWVKNRSIFGEVDADRG